MSFLTSKQYNSGIRLVDDKGTLYLVKSSVDLKYFGVGDGFLTTVEVIGMQTVVNTSQVKESESDLKSSLT